LICAGRPIAAKPKRLRDLSAGDLRRLTARLAKP
jgi:hypothetical protein